MQTVQINEPLVVSNIVKSKKIFVEMIDAHAAPIEFDLQHVDDCDTSGVQLLLAVCRHAMEDKRQISFCNFSEAVDRAFLNTGIRNINDFFTSEQ